MRVHVHGNCQALVMAGMLREVFPTWDISYFEVHANEIIDQIDDYHRLIRSADIILSQPIHPGYRGRSDLALEWLRENVKPGAELVVVPAMHFSAHHPGTDSFPLAGLPLLVNLLVPHLLVAGCSVADVVRFMMSPELLRPDDIDREIDAALTETRRREVDDGIDVPFSSFIAARARQRPMFHIQNHPFRETAAFVVNGVLARLGVAPRIPINGHEYQPSPHLPQLPCVVSYLERHGGGLLEGDTGLVRFPGSEPKTQAEYFSEIAERLVTFDETTLLHAMEARWPTVQMLRRLADNGSSLPGIERWASL